MPAHFSCHSAKSCTTPRPRTILFIPYRLALASADMCWTNVCQRQRSDMESAAFRMKFDISHTTTLYTVPAIGLTDSFKTTPNIDISYYFICRFDTHIRRSYRYGCCINTAYCIQTYRIRSNTGTHTQLRLSTMSRTRSYVCPYPILFLGIRKIFISDSFTSKVKCGKSYSSSWPCWWCYTSLIPLQMMKK